ncbi:hypothetical protein HELRODRAFT_168031 [Helobdella robusta]|uniref:Uncharacterized protein n=1 Tax=Helobdella robusta TaxID=6412 RepID=T1F030_HELRO|nr:hypothetical protein HELRODRAFT_168031 [Helobdella robusta]ESO10162.1 hypothetical protein HELRODRAFT_168031 [Helobdella robusta]
MSLSTESNDRYQISICPDLAVGAPYDGIDGGGAVYIFMGSYAGLLPYPSQILNNKYHNGMLSYPLRTFGFSLSAGYDVDKNGYPVVIQTTENLTTETKQRLSLFSYITGQIEYKTLCKFLKQIWLIEKEQIMTAITQYNIGLTCKSCCIGEFKNYTFSKKNLMVGSYQTETVTLIRSRPVVYVDIEMKANLTIIDLDTLSCISMEGNASNWFDAIFSFVL